MTSVFRPQPGPQEQFLSTSADIALYGGAAGGGKSFALLMEPLRHAFTVQGFYAVFFRRTTKQVRNPGGLWDESHKMYGEMPGVKPKENDLTWQFPSGARIQFAHMEYEKNKLDWQGSQIPLLGFDELTHFTAGQFWYMLSRNRSSCGVRPYVRATTNPEADSWVADLIAWWIDQDTGYAIPERSGVIRWFVRVNDAVVWADTPEELSEQYPGLPPKSFTFINAKLSDNQALVAADPGYMANLMALPAVERGRLLDGNWKIRPSAGLYFQRSWVKVIEPYAVPPLLRKVRGWDLAATPKTESNDPDWTVGNKQGISKDGEIIILDHTFMRGTAGQVKQRVYNVATQDGADTTISIAQDPGQAGKAQKVDYARFLRGKDVRFSLENGDKIVRFSPFSAQAEAGNVSVVRAPWNERFFAQLEGFPEMAHDDDVDAVSRAFTELSKVGFNALKRMRAYVGNT